MKFYPMVLTGSDADMLAALRWLEEKPEPKPRMLVSLHTSLRMSLGSRMVDTILDKPGPDAVTTSDCEAVAPKDCSGSGSSGSEAGGT